MPTSKKVPNLLTPNPKLMMLNPSYPHDVASEKTHCLEAFLYQYCVKIIRAGRNVFVPDAEWHQIFLRFSDEDMAGVLGLFCIVFRGYLSCYDSQVRLHAPSSRMSVLSRHHRFFGGGLDYGVGHGHHASGIDWEYSHALMDRKAMNKEKDMLLCFYYAELR